MYSLSEIASIVDESIGNLDLKGEPDELYAPIEYMMSIGGKRLRPRLCLTIFNLFKDKIDEGVIFPALAIEVFHTFTLIHDDIMDNSDLRRGLPTVHKKWGNNLAILSGDVMSIKSYQFLAKAPKDKLTEVLTMFTTTAAQVCEGQQFDMRFEQEKMITQDDYLKMIGLKTAVLFACAAKMGAVIGGADEQTAQSLYMFAYNLGIAFQITDDFLDVYGDKETFGKPIGGDIVNNKKSWLLVETMRLCDEKQKERLTLIMKMEEDNPVVKIDKVMRLYEELNMKYLAESAIMHYYNAAIASISGLDLSEKQEGLIKDIAHIITNRNM